MWHDAQLVFGGLAIFALCCGVLWAALMGMKPK